MTGILPSSSLESSSRTSTCSICDLSPSKYTCPRCTTRTCSAKCSKTHKESTGCSGERDRVKYVPMKEYGWGTMMNDYVFLEEMGRRVAGLGKEIVKGGFDISAGGMNKDALRGVPMGRGRGRGRGGANTGQRRQPGAFSKKDLLKLQLEARDIFVELLPQGMERKRVNQSRWNSRNNSAQLTISFTFHPPRPDPLQSSNSTSPLQVFTVVTHKNEMSTPLLTLARQAVSDAFKSKKKSKDSDGPPEWMNHFLTPHPDDPESFKMPHCVMNAKPDPRTFQQSTSRTKRREALAAYYQLDLGQPLGSVLKHTYFVEFPSVEFFEEGTFHGVIVDPQSATIQKVGGPDSEDEDEFDRPKKRRKVTATAKAAMKGMLGDYGSGEEGEEEGTEKTTGLSLLGAYAGSDEEQEVEDLVTEGGIGDEKKTDEEVPMDDIQLEGKNVMELDFGSDDEDGDGDTEIDPAVLLELVRQAQGGEPWKETNEDEEQVDWGNSDDDPEDVEEDET